MTAYSSPRRSAVVVAALGLATLLVASASYLPAGEITYNIVDYPLNEADTISSGMDAISGTIITDGTTGPLMAANIIGGTFSFTTATGDVITGAATFGDPVGLEATTTELLLDPVADSSFSIRTSNPLTSYSIDAQVTYENTAGGTYDGSVLHNYYLNPLIEVVAQFGTSDVPTTPGSIGANSSWVIAGVPEPPTLAMLGAGAAALFAIAMRRRQRAAMSF